MKPIYKLSILTLCLFITGLNLAQTNYTARYMVNANLKDNFLFTRHWDYAWDVFKEDNGKFNTADGRKLRPADTAHLYFTANCKTNVQGGYTIRYAYAKIKDSVITLTFSDGLPAYASEFTFYIKKDSFYFKPSVIYPAPTPHTTYRVDKESLVLNRSKYNKGDFLTGYADVRFTEIVAAHGEQVIYTALYIKGYFKTKLEW